MNLWQNHSKLLSQIQRIGVTVIQKYIKQTITLNPECPAKEPVEQTGMTAQSQDRKATQRSETKRKIVKCLPSFTPDYYFTAEN